jgi:hypothetical protein
MPHPLRAALAYDRVLRAPKHPPMDPEKPARRSRYLPWAQLLARTFKLDVEQCPRPGCSGRMKLLALVQDPAQIRRFLSHLGLYTAPAARTPARAPPYYKSPVLRRRHSEQLAFSA